MAIKSKYKYIYFEKIKEHVWVCKNKKAKNSLGHITWYIPWKRFVFDAYPYSAVFSRDCLEDIVDFMKQLETEV